MSNKNPTIASKNISRYEVGCKCGCGFDTLDFETLAVVQDVCDHFAIELSLPKVMLRITSGCRCPLYNASVGGAKDSFHTKGRAVDIQIVGVLPTSIYAYLSTKYDGKYGVGAYDTFTHLDTRTNGPARW